MENKDLVVAALILLVAFNIGLAYGDDVIEQIRDVSNNDNQQRQPEHAHAQFYVVVDGEPLSFVSGDYQLNRRDVHLEGNRSNIVHKHYSGVTWKTFVDSINVSASMNNTEVCLDAKNISRCDQGNFTLNGEPADLSKEIEQDDRLVIVLGENSSATARDYLERELPEPYTNPATRGRSI